jgi:RHS repeat-associated protein
MLVDGSGNVQAKYLYDSFGNTLGMWGALAAANVYRYSSKEVDWRTGQYYYGYRFYDPNLQRWVNQDPIGERGGLNIYRAMDNNPINEVDYFGFWGGEAEANPGGVNGVPYIKFNPNPDGSFFLSNNDDPKGVLFAGFAFPLTGLAEAGGFAGMTALGLTAAEEAEEDEAIVQQEQQQQMQRAKVPCPSTKDSDFGPKVSDPVPKNGVPPEWTQEQINDAIADYRASIASRKAEQAAFDAGGLGNATERLAHAQRITEEEQFLQSLLKAAKK